MDVIPDRLEVATLHHRWGCDNAAAGYPQPEPKGYWDYPAPAESLVSFIQAIEADRIKISAFADTMGNIR